MRRSQVNKRQVRGAEEHGEENHRKKDEKIGARARNDEKRRMAEIDIKKDKIGNNKQRE